MMLSSAQLTRIQIRLLNAVLIGGIVFISTLSLEYPPTQQNLWAALIGGSLAMLTQIKGILEDLGQQPPEIQIEREGEGEGTVNTAWESRKTKAEADKKLRLGVLIG